MIPVEEYFKTTSAPAGLQKTAEDVKSFISFNQEQRRRVVLVTSGGTTVPLEAQTVRFLDNFSAGTRGATSAEYFIEKGYAVIFLHRQFSLEPYTRHYTHSKNCFLDLLEIQGDAVAVEPGHLAEIRKVMKKYQKANAERLLLKLSFTTVSEYLFLLRSIALLMVPLGSSAMFYLAAAVSDFFIPQSKMVEHKIQSADGGLHLDLDQVPKIIKPLVEEWAFNAFTVSFKLETDENLLIPKSKGALEKYGHNMVIANLLHSRKYVVWLVTKDSQQEVRLSPEEQKSNYEIEHYIIDNLVKVHDKWISQHS
ncbi:hypothetical protein HDU91_002240 [Kappamyces sp. JEL0680]|nr:hypothetical protein HDU91_002240 [Kappamyces sp. JEL0680]